ncbi:MAG TPA: protein kinase [Kofleriaceae bacterium]|nr:protein kinase [Kofleriaceae bacterium]
MNEIGAIPEIGVRIREYNRLAGEFPSSSLAAFNLALDLWKSGQEAPACEAARHALAIEPALIDQLPSGLAAALRVASAGAGESSTDRLGEVVAGFRVTHRLSEDPRTQLYRVERGSARGYLRVLRRSLSQSPAVAARFVESAKLLQRISHPGLATILDAGMLADGCAYVLFQPEPGEPLSERIWREEPLAPLAPALGTLAGALATLHAQRACYLGLQPERIQVVEAEAEGAGASLQLLDSEHVRAAILQSPTPTITNGTVREGVDPILFMAPESFSGRAEVGPPADVYAFGVLAYLVLCGQPPLAAQTIGEVIAAHLNRAPVPVRVAAPGVPEELARLVDAMLDKDPGRRPAMASVAEAWARSLAAPAAPAPRAPAAGPAAPAELAELTVGSMLGDYRLVKKLGEGRTGVVFEAVHERLRRRDAIKVIRPEFSRSAEDSERFLREAQAANQVAHPGILSILQQARAPNGQIYTVMELLEGGSIGDRIGDGPMPAERVQRLGRQVALAIAAAHEHGVIHRDLKPENVLLVRDPDVPGGERIKVVDFGTANLTESGTRSGPYVEGTPAYMSPEQLRDTRTAGTKTDVHALGVMMQEMLAGKRRPGRTDPPASCPRSLAALVLRMQDPDPDRRPDMNDVAALLAPAPPARRRWIVPAAAGLAAIAAIVIGGLLWHRHVERSKPVAAFDHEILRFTGSSVAAQFENHTTGSREGIEWLWTFDDGTTSTQEAPAHEFRCTADKQRFTVSLRARNKYDPEGSTLTRQDLIRITPPPAPAPRVLATITGGCPAGGPCEASFAERIAPVLQCQAPCKVRFEDTSGGTPGQICWRSGTEAERCGRSLRVEHEYRTSGTYLITRRATYDCGQARSAMLQLRVTPPVLVRPPRPVTPVTPVQPAPPPT